MQTLRRSGGAQVGGLVVVDTCLVRDTCFPRSHFLRAERAEEGEGRTRNLRFWRPPLCLLSYLPVKTAVSRDMGGVNFYLKLILFKPCEWKNQV